MTDDHSTFERLFNTPLECGLRLLFVLEASKPMKADLQRLITYDYLLVHSADADRTVASLHPAVPFRGGEWLVKRDIVRNALDLMFSRELLNKRLDAAGIFYSASPLTGKFTTLLKSQYAQDLAKRAEWMVAHFGEMKDAELSDYMTENVGRWGSEFERLSTLHNLELS